MVKLLPFYLHCIPLEGYTPYIMVCILFHLSTLTNLFLLFYASDACTSFGKTSSRKPLNTDCLSELMRLAIYSTTHAWFVFTQITSCSPIGIKRNGSLPVTSKVSIASFVTPDVTYLHRIQLFKSRSNLASAVIISIGFGDFYTFTLIPTDNTRLSLGGKPLYCF